MKNKKPLILALAVFIILVAAGSVYLVLKYSPKSGVSVIPNANQPLASEEKNASSSEPAELNDEQKVVVDSYARERFDKVSQVILAADRAWSIKSINFLDANNADIEYTDGQIIKKGKINFRLDGQNKISFLNFFVENE